MYDFPISFLNSNNGNAILAFGNGPEITLRDGDVLEGMESFIQENKGQHIFLCLSYDLKNTIEKLSSENKDGIDFPLAILWVPKYVVRFKNGPDSYRDEFVQGNEDQESLDFIKYFKRKSNEEKYAPLPHDFVPRTSRADYLSHVNRLKEEIQQGNIYEVNYCQEFYAENVELPDPFDTYFKLNSLTKAPYSTFFSIDEFTIFSGSPERYLRRKNNKLTSSPIKGTRKRGKSTAEDEILKTELLNDPKERAENVMIVDLVRNDLSRVATPKSVKVDELFGIYTFETVHQMISTISCEVSDDTSFTEILRATFPMGSMTGAPKISAMKLIDRHEDFRRGIYSGSIGFIEPNGDFDLNVVIRSLIYNKKEKYLSCPVGGAITIKSSAESEYEECLVKVKGILDRMNA